MSPAGGGLRSLEDGEGAVLDDLDDGRVDGVPVLVDGELPEHGRDGLQLAERLGERSARVAALNNLALVERDSGRLESARTLTEQALAMCACAGDRHRQAALENNLADIHHALGDPEAAMDHLKRAVAMFAEVGGDEASRLPEVWKLASW